MKLITKGYWKMKWYWKAVEKFMIEAFIKGYQTKRLIHNTELLCRLPEAEREKVGNYHLLFLCPLRHVCQEIFHLLHMDNAKTRKEWRRWKKHQTSHNDPFTDIFASRSHDRPSEEQFTTRLKCYHRYVIKSQGLITTH